MRAALALLLALSLAANALLLFAPQSSPTSATAAKSPTAPPLAPAAPPTSLGASLNAMRDGRAALDRLRESGFPDRIALSVAQYLADLEGKRQLTALKARQRAAPPQALAAARAAAKEVTTLERSIEWQGLELEMALPDNESFRENRALRYGPVSRAQEYAADRIIHDYTALFNDLLDDVSDPKSPEFNDRVRLLAREFQTDLARLFTSEQLLEFNLRNYRGNGSRLAVHLAALNLSEAEFRAAYAAVAGTDDLALGWMALPSADLTPAAQSRLAESLGANRVADRDRLREPDYRRTARFAEIYQLASSATAEIWSVKTAAEARAKSLHADAALDPTKRTAALVALARDAETKVAAKFTAAQFASYRRQLGGWLTALTSPPKP